MQFSDLREEISFQQRETIITVQSKQQNEREAESFNEAFSFQQPQQLSQTDNQIEVNESTDNQSFSQKKTIKVEKNDKKDTIFTAARKRKVLIDEEYLKSLHKFDSDRGNDLLISYFCTIGMDEDDILHNIMNIKELEMHQCGLNQYQYDNMIANPEILTGERVYNDDQQPNFFLKN